MFILSLFTCCYGYTSHLKSNKQIIKQWSLRCCLSIDSSLSRNNRLQRILSLVDNNILDQGCIADIGGDHGILTAALVRHLTNSKNIYKVIYTDQSLAAVVNARKYFEKENVTTNVIVGIGSGLEPLLPLQLNCCCIVIAGMGSNSMYEIISHKPSLSPLATASSSLQLLPVVHDSLYEDSHQTSAVPFSITDNEEILSMDRIGVRHIIVQPYPPNLYPMLKLFQFLDSNGWTATDQSIDQGGKWHYISTKFSKSSSSFQKSQKTITNKNAIPSGDDTAKDISVIFENMPLTVQYTNYADKLEKASKGEIDWLDNDENRKVTDRWVSYLRKELKTIQKRLYFDSKTTSSVSLFCSDTVIKPYDDNGISQQQESESAETESCEARRRMATTYETYELLNLSISNHIKSITSTS